MTEGAEANRPGHCLDCTRPWPGGYRKPGAPRGSLREDDGVLAAPSPPRSLDAAGREAAHQVALDRREEHDDGHDRDDRGREEMIPVLDVGRHVGGDDYRNWRPCRVSH